ncbi:MAG TPA: hypothetical protein VLV86_17385 [Vicinamibacterales bacterium]|nr:hypothetical protein [Vicinamibacterales bacterium]
MTRLGALVVTFLGVVLCTTLVRGQARTDYREFALGSPVTRVVELTHLSKSDVSPIHAQPALIQELRWRPPYLAARTNELSKDPVQQMLFSFVDDQLFKITIDYDQARTEGMTDSDMSAALSALYGSSREPLAATTPSSPAAHVSLDAKTAVARWENGDVVVVLWRNTFTAGLQLVVTSERLDSLARVAGAEAIRIEAAAAPALDLARRQRDADELRAAKDKARTANKAAFRP